MRALRLLTAIAASAVLAGCASARAATPASPASPTAPAGPVVPAAPAAGAVPAATASQDAAATPSTSAGGPSASSLMVCGPEIGKDVATILALPPTPATTATWTDQLYTCTYHLPSGTLVLSVKESADTASAVGYFSTLRAQLGATTALTGAEALGNSGYESATGSVVILKDDKILRVDASALPAASGAAHLTRTDLAYEIATDIIGCWNGS